MSRAELELSVRAELVDLAPTSWHARLAGDYILQSVEAYLQTERERQERRQREVEEFFLAGRSGGGEAVDEQVARWISAEWHRAVCPDDAHAHDETPWSAAVSS